MSNIIFPIGSILGVGRDTFSEGVAVKDSLGVRIFDMKLKSALWTLGLSPSSEELARVCKDVGLDFVKVLKFMEANNLALVYEDNLEIFKKVKLVGEPEYQMSKGSAEVLTATGEILPVPSILFDVMIQSQKTNVYSAMVSSPHSDSLQDFDQLFLQCLRVVLAHRIFHLELV